MFSFFLIDPRMVVGAVSMLCGLYFLCVCMEDIKILIAYWQSQKSIKKHKIPKYIENFNISY